MNTSKNTSLEKVNSKKQSMRDHWRKSWQMLMPILININRILRGPCRSPGVPAQPLKCWPPLGRTSRGPVPSAGHISADTLAYSSSPGCAEGQRGLPFKWGLAPLSEIGGREGAKSPAMAGGLFLWTWAV